MFKAVNVESESDKRLCEFEKKRIEKSYLATLKTLNLDSFLATQIKYEQNLSFYKNAYSNLLVEYVSIKCDREILENLEKYKILEHTNSFFELLRKSIKNENFIRAKKLLNLAKSKNWMRNEYYDLKRELEQLYFNKTPKKTMI